MQSTGHRKDRKVVNKPVCEHEDVTVLWNQRVHTNRKVTQSTPDIIIKSKRKRKHAY
jgi:hypothetical protein